MYLNDEKAREIIIDIMDIEDDEDMLKSLDDWIKENGIEKLFLQLIEVYAIFVNR